MRKEAMDALLYPSCLGSMSEVNQLEEPGSSSDNCPSTPASNLLCIQAEASNAANRKLVSYIMQSTASSENLTYDENGIKICAQAGTEENKKPKRKHKKRSKNWTRLETLKLIDMRTELDEWFRRDGKKSILWEEIAQSLQKNGFSRDAQQCKDKWEKLTVGYKDVRDGARDEVDHPFFEELHRLLSWKAYRRDGPLEKVLEPKRVKVGRAADEFLLRKDGVSHMGTARAVEEGEPCSAGKSEHKMTHADLTVIQVLMEIILSWQQQFFKDLLDAVERKEQTREHLRNEREDKWRVEDRAERLMFQNAMVALIQRVLGENTSPLGATIVPTPSEGHTSVKKRSKNWQRSEVLHLIRLRKEMGPKFTQSSRKATLWDELGVKLMRLGVMRDGKQCREKWDKLMAEYKDVCDGRKGKEESPYFAELATILVNDEANIVTTELLREE